MKKQQSVFRTIFLTVMVFAVVSALLGCKQGTENSQKQKVTITIQGDDNITSGKGSLLTAEKGAKWSKVKTSAAINGITFKDGFELSEWKLNNAAGITLTDGYSFNSDVAVFAVSKNKIPEQTGVTITIQGDENVTSGKGSSFTVEKGSKWSTVKTHSAITGINFKETYSLDTWKIGGINGKELTDDYVFNSGQIIFAVSTLYVKVAYKELNTYLEKKASPSKVSYIEITGISSDKLSAPYPPVQPDQCSLLGAILNEHSTKQVALKLPKEVAGLTDMSYCFSKCPTLKSLYAIPQDVVILNGCFYKCENLTEAPLIPESVTDMSLCFKSCVKLEKAPNIPQGVENMKECFAKCTALRTVLAVPSSIKNMDGCFYSCKNLSKAPVIASGVSGLDMSGCFFLCENLTEIPSIPDGVTSMLNCFYGCKKLKTVPSIPNGITNMKFCFKDCIELTSVPNIPATVNDIYGCFWGCENLKTAPAIPQGIKNMTVCFWKCKKLVAGPVIPESVVNMLMTFKDCTSLKTIVLNCNYNDGFTNTFADCGSLEAGGIKVKNEYLPAYKSKADKMGTTQDKFAAQ